ncbi:MAG: hypothetical protein V3U45_07085 [bacterium]
MTAIPMPAGGIVPGGDPSTLPQATAQGTDPLAEATAWLAVADSIFQTHVEAIRAAIYEIGPKRGLTPYDLQFLNSIVARSSQVVTGVLGIDTIPDAYVAQFQGLSSPQKIDVQNAVIRVANWLHQRAWMAKTPAEKAAAQKYAMDMALAHQAAMGGGGAVSTIGFQDAVQKLDAQSTWTTTLIIGLVIALLAVVIIK